MAKDWIDNFVESTAAIPSPERFRLWAGITALSGVMERKVWTQGAASPIYPHLFTVLVGTPGSGKDNAIRPVRELWSKMSGLILSPDNVTKAALIDALSRSTRTVLNGATTMPYMFSAMAVPAPEFGVFFPNHDTEFLSVLNHIYTSPPNYREERRTTGPIDVEKPHLVLLGGTQPDFLNSLLPEEAWGMGFAARLNLIYAEGAPPADIFGSASNNLDHLVVPLREIFNLKGEFIWSKEARNELNTWNRANCPPTPTHNRLLHYNTRRGFHTLKLSMISAVARSQEMHVTVEDFERAMNWMLEAEKVMPDIFHAMGQRSDAQIITDLHFYCYRIYSSVVMDQRKALDEKVLYEWLVTRVPSEKIAKLIEIAVKSGYFRQGNYPGSWIPNLLDKLPKLN